MSALERLERAKGGPFTYLYGGEVRGLPSPVEIRPAVLLDVLQREHRAFVLPKMPAWKAAELFRAWCEHYDLPDHRGAGRLQYLLERYSNALEFDLRVHASGADLGELWRSRRWRYLLNLIDHLPSHSHYAMVVSQDEEHAKMLAEALEARRESGDAYAPPLTSWTPEVSVLADLVDSVNALRHAFIVANSEKGRAPKPPAPYARPKSALAAARKRAEYDRRKAAHDGLAARLLPHKRPGWVAPEAPERDTPSAARPAGPGTEFLRRKARSSD